MWDIILKALLKELESNPDRILTIIEKIIDLFRSHPDAMVALINRVQPKP